MCARKFFSWFCTLLLFSFYFRFCLHHGVSLAFASFRMASRCSSTTPTFIFFWVFACLFHLAGAFPSRAVFCIRFLCMAWAFWFMISLLEPSGDCFGMPPMHKTSCEDESRCSLSEIEFWGVQMHLAKDGIIKALWKGWDGRATKMLYIHVRISYLSFFSLTLSSLKVVPWWRWRSCEKFTFSTWLFRIWWYSSSTDITRQPKSKALDRARAHRRGTVLLGTWSTGSKHIGRSRYTEYISLQQPGYGILRVRHSEHISLSLKVFKARVCSLPVAQHAVSSHL